MDKHDLKNENLLKFMQAVNQLVGIPQINFYVEQIGDEKKDSEEVIDIFNRLNSAGTRLSKGDLALARISAKWPDVRKVMGESLEYWANHGSIFLWIGF